MLRQKLARTLSIVTLIIACSFPRIVPPSTGPGRLQPCPIIPHGRRGKCVENRNGRTARAGWARVHHSLVESAGLAQHGLGPVPYPRLAVGLNGVRIKGDRLPG